METLKVKLSGIRLLENNPRQIKEQKMSQLINSILVFPKMLEIRPIVIDENNTILGGNMRYRALRMIVEKGMREIKSILSRSSTYNQKSLSDQNRIIDFWNNYLTSPFAYIVKADSLTEDEKKEFIITDNI